MQRALTSAEQSTFRNRPQRAQWYAAVHKPASLYSVPISETPVQHPASRISVYSSSAVGTFSLAKKDMTVWVGTLPGGSEEGKIRLRANATAGDFLDIAESGSGINRYYAAKWLTVVDEIQPTVKHPRYDTDASQWRMDYNETYGNQFEVGKYGPLIIMGSPDAGFLKSGSITMKFHAGSTVFLDGTTVSTATWTFPDGQTKNGLATEAAPHEVTFIGASPRGAYVVLSVTDSAGKTEESRRLIWAFNDKTSVPKVEFGNVSGGVRDKGYRASFKVFNNANQDDFPEGAEVVIFESASVFGVVDIDVSYLGSATSQVIHDSDPVTIWQGITASSLRTYGSFSTTAGLDRGLIRMTDENWAVMLRDNSQTPNKGLVIPISVSGTTIASGTSALLFGGSDISRFNIVETDINKALAVMTILDGSVLRLNAQAMTISPSSVDSVGAVTEILGGLWNQSTGLARHGTESALVAYVTSTATYIRKITQNGNTVSAGAAWKLQTGRLNHTFVENIGASKFVVISANTAATEQRYHHVELAGGSVIINGPFTSNIGGKMYNPFAKALSTSSVALRWMDDDNSPGRIEMRILEISGTSIIPGGSYQPFGVTSLDSEGYVSKYDGGKFLISAGKIDNVTDLAYKIGVVSGSDVTFSPTHTTGISTNRYQYVVTRIIDNGPSALTVYNSGGLPQSLRAVIHELQTETSQAQVPGWATSPIGTNYPHREHIVFRGWIVSDNDTVNPFNSFVQFNAETIDGILKRTSSYDIFHADSTPIAGASHWVEMEHMTVDRVAIDIIKRRSTISKVADFHVASGLLMTARINYQDLAKSSVWSQLELNYGERGTRGLIAADLHSALYAQEDGQVSGGSLNVPVMMHIQKRDRRDSVLWESPHYDQNSETEMYGVMVIPGGSEWRGENTSIIPIGGESPGDVMGYHGTTTEHSRGLVADSQDRIITWSGNWRAQLNSKYRKVGVPMSGYLKMDAVPQARVTMSLSSVDNARGISWNNKQFFVTALNLQYNGQAVLTDVAIEEVVNGKGGSAITFPRYDNIAPLPTPNPPPPQFLPPPGCIASFNTLNGTKVYDAERKSWVARDTSLAAGNRRDLNGVVLPTQKYAVKAGVGYMLRSENIRTAQDPNQPLTDWGSVMTPGVALPGAAPIGNTNLVRYHQIIPDRSNANKMIAIANQKESGTWYSWLGYTQNMGDTWAWVSVGGETANASANMHTPYYGASDAGSNVGDVAYSPNTRWNSKGGGGMAQSNGAFDTDYGFIMYRDRDFMTMAVAYQITGTSINLGSAIDILDNPEMDRWQCVGINDLDGITIFTEQDGSDFSLWTRAVRRTDGTRILTRSTERHLITDESGSIRDIHIAKLDDTAAMIVVGDGGGGYYRKATVSGGGSLTVTDRFSFIDQGGVGLPWSIEVTGGTRVARLDDVQDWAVITSGQGGVEWGDGQPYQAWLVDIQGASFANYGPFTFPASPVVATNGYGWFSDTVPAGTNRFVTFYRDASNASKFFTVVGQRSGSTITFSSPVEFPNSVNIFDWGYDLFEISSSQVGLLRRWDDSGANEGFYINIGLLSGTSLNWLPTSGFETEWGIGGHGQFGVMLDSERFMMVGDDTSYDLLMVAGSIIETSTGEGKSLSGELSAGGGRAYVTYSDGVNIKLKSYQLPGLTQENEVTLSQGTIAEVDAKTWWVGVKTYNKHVNSVNNTAIWVYGRMDNLSTPVSHLAVSGDAGQTYSVIEAGLGTDNIAGLEVGSGRLHAFRNMSNGFVAYYIGWNAIIPISVAPLHIDYRGTALTSDGYVLLGASTNSTVRIAYTKPVFAVWFDLTKDYPSTGAITGLGLI